MIPAGHEAVDRAGIAVLHGLTDAQARRRKPWAQPGHPAPLTSGRIAVWDLEQATAYAEGEPIPVLPEGEHAGDLLNLFESAELAGLKADTWMRYMSHERAHEDSADERAVLVPAPDREVFGYPYWSRSTVESYKDARQQRAGKPSGGRPKGSTATVSRDEIGPRIAALLEERDADGEPLSAAEIARRAEVHYSTVLRHIRQLRRK